MFLGFLGMKFGNTKKFSDVTTLPEGLSFQGNVD